MSFYFQISQYYKKDIKILKQLKKRLLSGVLAVIENNNKLYYSIIYSLNILEEETENQILISKISYINPEKLTKKDYDKIIETKNIKLYSDCEKKNPTNEILEEVENYNSYIMKCNSNKIKYFIDVENESELELNERIII